MINKTEELINKLAHHEIEAWKGHHRQNSEKHMHELASVYHHLYQVPYHDALVICKPHWLASWKHDVAEAFDDEGIEPLAEKYWGIVEGHLKDHYRGLLELRHLHGTVGSEFDDQGRRYRLGDAIAQHDTARFRVHHVRNFPQYLEETSQVYSLLTGISIENARSVIDIMLEPMKLHDHAEKHEDAGDQGVADKYWNEAEMILRDFYDALIDHINKGRMV